MSKPSFTDTDDYYRNPEAFIKYRLELEPFDTARMHSLLGHVSRVVMSAPQYTYRSTAKGAIGYTFEPRDLNDLKAGVEYIDEIDGPMRTADNRAMDLRMFTRNSSLQQDLGFLAFAGIDWKPTPHLEDLIQPGEIAEAFMGGLGVHITADIGSIDNLWVLSTDNLNSWITDYQTGRSITDFEYDQLVSDLAAYPAV